MNRRILIATVAALSLAGITAASAEPDSSGAGGASIGTGSYGYQTGGYATQGYASDGYMSYGSANTRVQIQDGYAGPRTSYQYRAQPRGAGQLCLDEDGNRFACR